MVSFLSRALFSPSAPLLLACLWASTGAVWDVRTRRIPNRLTGCGFACGLLLHFWLRGWAAMGWAAVAGLVGGGIFLIFFVLGGMGAGDVKLMAAVAAVAGFGHLMEMLFAIAIFGGIMAIALAMARGRLKTTLANVITLAGHHSTAGLLPHPELNVNAPGTLRLPYGLPIAVGCWFTFFAAGVWG